MTFINLYIVPIFIFLPLFASFFITLIPAQDMSSKLALSRFFSAVGLLAFLKVFFGIYDGTVNSYTNLSFTISNININFNLYITRYNILLFGATAVALLANMITYHIKDFRSNINQVMPFLLVFILYISFGQTNIKIALPLLSVANFFIYFMMSITDKPRRGATIFQMGIFIFFCDALALILLQTTPENSKLGTLMALCLCMPGLARLGIPMFAPFGKKLLLNVDDYEGPFLVTFLQFAGLFILIVLKPTLNFAPQDLSILISVMATVSALYIVLVAVIEPEQASLPYYFLIFYSCLTTLSIFTLNTDTTWAYIISLFLTNIACFFHLTRFTLAIKQIPNSESPKWKAFWFLRLVTAIGIPGIGMGTSLWVIIYQFIYFGFFNDYHEWTILWRILALVWIAAILLVSIAAIASLRKQQLYIFENQELYGTLPSNEALLFAPLIVVLISIFIPVVAFYTVNRGM